MVSRRFKLAVTGGAALGVGAAASFGPFVRWEAGKAAARYGAVLSIEQVVPTWRGVRLRGVGVTVADVPSATARIDEIDVRHDGGFQVELRGGLVSAVGPRDVVAQQLETWRSRLPASTKGSSDGAASRGGISVTGLGLSWRDRAEAPGQEIVAKGVDLLREPGAMRLRAAESTVTTGPLSLAVREGVIVLARTEAGLRLASVAAAGVQAELVLDPPGAGVEPPDVAPASTVDAGGEHRGVMARTLLARAAQGLDGAIGPEAHVELAGLKAVVRRGDETLRLGPGTLAVKRDGDAMTVELAPAQAVGERTEEQALTFRVRIPLPKSGGPEAEIVADIRGGPIWLSTLGIAEGDFGLLDVGRTALSTQARVVLSADGKSMRVDGDGRLSNLSLRSSALSDEPVRGVELAWRGRGEAVLDGSRVVVEDGEVDLGHIRVLGSGVWDRGKTHRVQAKFELPLTPCQSMLESIPRGLVPKLGGMTMAGSFAVRGHAKFDTSRIEREFDVRWDASNSCRIVDVPPDIHVSRFKKAFRRTAYGPDGEQMEIDVGPETPGWFPYSSISKFMEVAVLTTEDGAFFRHRGFDEEAIRNSIRENLKAGKFVRGASTISMQLSRNLYLDRKKNLSRKLQEAVLTMYLEQELTKEQLLELYLNVIEFGPMVYGIGPATRHYFSSSAAGLSLSQALYLSSILPNPKKQHFGAGGAVTGGWTSYLRKLMHIAHKRKRITDEELEHGLEELVVRGAPAPHRAPREGSSEEAAGSDPDPPSEG